VAIISNLIARLRADTASFDRKMNKSRRHTNSFTKGVKMMGRQMLLIAGVGGGIYAIQRGLKSIIKAASDAEETQAKFNTVFKELSEQANKWAKSFGKSVGRSEQSVKSWMARLQDTFVPLGIARDRAMELSKSLVSLAVDVASFNNAADADVIRDFTSALVGNHETVRKYGIIIGETAIKQEAMRKGLNKTYKELTDLEKVQLRYSLIQRGSTDAQGDALRTANSFANQVKRLKANFSDLSKEIGVPFMEAMNKLITSVNKNSEAWGKFFKTQAEGWAEILSGFESVRDIMRMLDEKAKKSGKRRFGVMTGRDPGGVFTQPRIRPLPVGTLEISPKRAQVLAEMRARARALKEQTELAIGPSKKQIEIMEEAIEVEKGLQELRAIGRKRLLDDLIEEGNKRKEIVTSTMRIQEDIAAGMAREFSNTIDTMIFEGKRFAEAMTDMLRSILRMIIQIMTYEMIAKPIAFGIMGKKVPEAQTGGYVERGGLARIHRGETIIPATAANVPTIIINNNTGVNLMQDEPPRFDGENWVVNIVTKAIDTNISFRRKMGITR